MQYIPRFLTKKIKRVLNRKKSILLLGPRQTGKSTLINHTNTDLQVALIKPNVRQRYEKNPDLIESELISLKTERKIKQPIIVVDEVQRVPEVLDTAQDIIDRNIAIFIFTGSSARKLRRNPNVNLLPGRVISLRLDPLIFKELPSLNLNELLVYGSLPGIVTLKKSEDKEQELESYVTTYLEEEVRAESIVRNLAHFGRFLELAASESGNIVNFRKLSQEIGISHTTVISYYQILEDCLIVERVEPITKSKTRKKLTKSNKYLFFDLGVRRVAAIEGVKQPREALGKLFEQLVGLELVRCSRLSNKKTKVRFWRDPDGTEVDWIIESGGEYTPIETKLTDSPKENDIKHLKIFLKEYKNSKHAYLICQTPKRLMMEKNISVIPWEETDSLIL